jgi:hypothetical protein
VVSCSSAGSCRRATYNDAGNALLRVAVALQVLRDCGENAGWERHVEDPVGLLATLLKLLEVLLKCNERVILVILPGNVCAEAAKLVQLLLDLLCGRLDVRLDALEVLLVVHLCPRISDDANVLGEEVVAVLCEWSATNHPIAVEPRTRPKSAGNCLVLAVSPVSLLATTHCLLLCQITRGTQHYDDGVVLELFVAVRTHKSANVPSTVLSRSRHFLELPLQYRTRGSLTTTTTTRVERSFDGISKGCKKLHH